MTSMPEPLTINRVTYHGGFSHVAPDEVPVGRLVADEDAITLQEARLPRGYSPVEICRTKVIASIDVTKEPPKSKAREFAFFGLIGAAMAAGEEGPTMILHLQNGEAGYFTVGNQTAASLLGAVTPWMREHGIAFGTLDQEPAQPDTPKLLADELAKLAQLRDSGVLTDDEFVKLKTQLIDDH